MAAHVHKQITPFRLTFARQGDNEFYPEWEASIMTGLKIERREGKTKSREKWGRKEKKLSELASRV